MLAEAWTLSGIVSILFCGIVMAHYTTHNLHPDTLSFSRRFFKVVAYGAETFVFVYFLPGRAILSAHQRNLFASKLVVRNMN
jgi:NhaP-type Na+/H+ or K+/H+ antiporter